ncbi:winged helix-turn-helix transcriptional regulator [Amycolatopsis anabasis]|uniref:winged helix-turn-helix transcriptional regulator n=1 Tax=Amycolatopsis anabasis TaxID=1840409 RepID=UPI001C552F80|nr:winged helix-turn-helix transcriptional regulator [Amycolatopsis anabasis]
MRTGTPKERNYRQYCGLAAGLDVIGERWTLLIVRELLLGPRRYNELLADLPGMGTNLLADRLKKLRELGVVEREEAGHGYRLGPLGEGLRESVLALSKWGVGLLGEPQADMVTRPHWGLLAVQAMADASRLPELVETYEFQVDDETFHLTVDRGTVSTARGPAADPAMSVRTDATTFVRIGAGVLGPFEALATGKLTFTGDQEAVLRCSTVLGLAERPGPRPAA